VPILATNNNDLMTAFTINEPLKSWAIYGELKADEYEYYNFSLIEGDRLRLSLFSPQPNNNFSIALIIPGHPLNADLPLMIELPVNHGSVLFNSEPTNLKEYEPFTPSSYYQLINIDLIVNESGTYYLTLYGEGKYGLAVGYKERFSLIEWLKIPLDVTLVHLWEGQGLLLILLPLIIIINSGLIICYKCKHCFKGLLRLLSFIAALSYFGSSGVTLNQMIIALINTQANPLTPITLIFIIIPSLLGYGVIRVINRRRIETPERVKLIAYAGLGLFSWAGFIFGPLLLVIASLLPEPKNKKRK
jgi:hypothetical protein